MRAWAVAFALLLSAPAASLMGDAVGEGTSWQAGRNDLLLPMDDGVLLEASLWLPPEALAPGAALPGVVAIHGWGDDKLDSWARREQQRGYVALAYSVRGFGDSMGQVDMAGPRSMADLHAVVAWLRTVAPVDPDRIGVVGPSLGGAHAALLAVDAPPGLAAVVTIVPWTDLAQAMRPGGVAKLSYPLGFYATGHGLVQDGHEPADLDLPPLDLDLGGLGRVRVTDIEAGRRALRDTYAPEVHLILASLFTGLAEGTADALMAERSALPRAGLARAPTLVMTGLTDDLFPLDQGLPFFEQLGAAEKMLYLGGAGHPRARERGAEVDQVFALMDRWLDHYLKGAGPRPFDPAAPIRVAPQPWTGATMDLARWPAPGDGEAHALTSAMGLDATQPGTPGEVVLAHTGVSGAPDDPFLGPILADLPPGTKADTAVFRGPPLIDGALLLGTPRAELVVRPLGTTMRLAVKVFDHDPATGASTLVTRGVHHVDDMLPGLAHRIAFDLQGIAWTFSPGHVVEVRVATDDVPHHVPARVPFAFALSVGEGGSAVRLPFHAPVP